MWWKPFLLPWNLFLRSKIIFQFCPWHAGATRQLGQATIIVNLNGKVYLIWNIMQLLSIDIEPWSLPNTIKSIETLHIETMTRVIWSCQFICMFPKMENSIISPYQKQCVLYPYRIKDGPYYLHGPAKCWAFISEFHDDAANDE